MEFFLDKYSCNQDTSKFHFLTLLDPLFGSLQCNFCAAKIHNTYIFYKVPSHCFRFGLLFELLDYCSNSSRFLGCSLFLGGLLGVFVKKLSDFVCIVQIFLRTRNFDGEERKIIPLWSCQVPFHLLIFLLTPRI